MNLGAPELLIVLFIIVLVFGASRLPRLGRSMGQAKAEFSAGRAESELDATDRTSIDRTSTDRTALDVNGVESPPEDRRDGPTP